MVMQNGEENSVKLSSSLDVINKNVVKRINKIKPFI